MSPLELLCMASLAALLGVAVFSDLRTRRIPNALVVTGIALGLLFQAAAPEGDGLFSRWWGAIGPLQGLYGLLTGLALFMPFYMLRTFGAGDVKLLGMVGAWLGPKPTIGVFLLTLLVGGVLALVVALWNRSLRQALANIRFMLTDTLVRAASGGAREVTAPARTSGRLPYAIAIAVGAGLEVALLKGWLR
jgi:prepilin peptidase CpaA